MKTTLVLFLLLATLPFTAAGAGGRPAPPAPVTAAAETAPQVVRPTPVPAEIPAAASGAPAAQLRAAQEDIGDLTADFTLVVSGAGPDGRDLVARGKVWLASGRRYAVEYHEPEAQQLVSDGAQRWLYLQKINQVQIQSLPPAGSSTEFFLEIGGGLVGLVSRCDVKSVVAPADLPQSLGFALIPLPDSGLDFRRARVWLDSRRRLPLRVQVEAARPVRVDFHRVTANTTQELLRDPEKALPASRFTFIPPADVEVIPLF